MHTPIIVGNSELYFGKCEDVLKELPSNSVDTIITDPPYGLGFMGKEWDTFSPESNERDTEKRKSHIGDREIKRPANEAGRYDRSAQANRQFQEFMTGVFTEAFRVAKPGAILMAFGGTRTYHRLTCAMEDAGWQIRDCLMWLFGSGFPKSHNIALSIDKKLGESNRGHRVATASRFHPDGTFEPNGEAIPAYKARTAIAKAWEGYGTGLKPAWEPIVVAMKPLDGTNADNALENEVAGYWIDGCRIPGTKTTIRDLDEPSNRDNSSTTFAMKPGPRGGDVLGRWPANVILDEESARLLDEQTGELSSGEPTGIKAGGQGNAFGEYAGGIPVTGFGDSGGASRFFYCAKAPGNERHWLDSIEIIINTEACEKNTIHVARKVVLTVVMDRLHPRVIGVSGIQEKNAKEWNTMLFGKLKMGQFPQDFKSTIETKTNSIIELKILNWLTHLLTNDSIAAAFIETEFNLSHVENVENSFRLNPITSEKTELAHGVEHVPSKALLKINVKEKRTSHPTIKPLSLMRYLCRLTRPPKGGVVLDMFAGSGTTLIAADLEDRKSIGIEMTPEYIEIIKQRVTHWHGQKQQAPDLFESEEIAELKQGELF